MKQQEDMILTSFNDLGKNQQKILLYMGKENGRESVTRQELVKFMVPSFKTENSAQNSVTSSLQRLNQRNLVESANSNIRRLSTIKLTKQGIMIMEYLKDLQLGTAECVGGKFLSERNISEETQGRIIELEKEKEGLLTKVKTLHTKVKTLEDQILLLVSKKPLKEDNGKIQRMEREREKLKAKVTSLMKKIEVLKAEISTEDLGKPLQEAEEKIQELEKGREKLRSIVEDLTGQIEGLKLDKKGLDKDSQGITELKEEIEALKTDLEELGDNGTHLENLIFYLQQELGPRLTGEQIESLKEHLREYSEVLFQ